MPVIKIWCLPEGLHELSLKTLHREVVAAAVSVEALGLRGEEDMTVLFPPDMMKYGLGTDIVIEAVIARKPERTIEVKNELARKLGKVVQKMYPDARVGCFVSSSHIDDGVWSSTEGNKPEVIGRNP